MSSQHPILGDRPINKWKVTELREELKRRNLTVKGLKDDLVKRLGEAIRTERAAIESVEDKDVDDESEPMEKFEDGKVESGHVEVVNEGLEGGRCEVKNIDGEAEEGRGIDDESGPMENFEDGKVESGHGKMINEGLEGGRSVVKNIDGGAEGNKGVDGESEPMENLEDGKVESGHVEMVNEGLEGGRSEVKNIAGEAEEGKGVHDESEPVENSRDSKVESSCVGITNEANEASEDGRSEVNKIDEVVGTENIGNVPNEIDQGKALEHKETVVTDSVTMVGEAADVEASAAISSIGDKAVLPHVTSDKGALETKSISQDDAVLDSFQKGAALVSEPITSDSTLQSAAEFLSSQVHQVVDDKNIQIVNNEVEGIESHPDTAVETIEIKLDDISGKSSQMDADRSEPYSSDKVYEVSHNLGLQVHSESFSNDTFTINKKNELKENLTANNVQLEPEIVRPEMVQPSSSKDPPGDGIVHPLDDPLSHDNQILVGETDDDKSKCLEFSKENDNADATVDVSMAKHNVENESTEKGEYGNELNQVTCERDMSPVPGLSPMQIEPSVEEKIEIAASREERKSQDDNDFSNIADGANGELLEKVNLDQSSPDDSMEEDASETRHVDSDHNSTKMGEKTEYNEDGRVDVLEHFTPSDKTESSNEHKDSIAAFSVKRKFQDSKEAGNNEAPKRQRRWGTENQEVPESQSPRAVLSTKPKASLLTTSTTTNLTRSDSTGREAAKERMVPPSGKAPTTSLRVDNFVRPFTLKAVQQLLAKTGTVSSFWMDHIKTHCYVTYSTVEEAIETRNAVYDIQWPPNGGRHLIADFVDPEEVKLRLEAPPKSAAPSVNASTSAVMAQPPQPAAPNHQQGPRQHYEPQHPLSRQPPARDPLTMREQLPGPPSPATEKTEPPIVTLDDLFRKTRATPRIYYLPLTDEQVAAKLDRQKRVRQ